MKKINQTHHSATMQRWMFRTCYSFGASSRCSTSTQHITPRSGTFCSTSRRPRHQAGRPRSCNRSVLQQQLRVHARCAGESFSSVFAGVNSFTARSRMVRASVTRLFAQQKNSILPQRFCEREALSQLLRTRRSCSTASYTP